MTRATACLLVATLAFLTSGEASHAQLASAVTTAEVAGTIVTAAAPATPLARVLVTISGGLLGSSRTVISDERGGFVFRGLPPGSYTVVAVRAPFVSTAFGAKRPGQPGTAVAATAGQRTEIVIALSAGAVITGIVRQPTGEPAVGIDVDVRAVGVTSTTLAPRVVTDDRGVFRAFGLAPGKYRVSAMARNSSRQSARQVDDAEIDERLDRLRRRAAPPAPGTVAPPLTPPRTTPSATYRYAPVYYPGTTDLAQASIVTVAAGEERSGIDIGLVLARALTIEGTITSPDGVVLTNTSVTARRQLPPDAATDPSATVAVGARVDAAGHFTIANLMPGTYRLLANNLTFVPNAAGRGGPGPASSTITAAHWALADITLNDTDARNVALTLRPGLKVRGRFVFESATGAPPSNVATIRVRLVESSGATPSVAAVAGDSGGSFELINVVPGNYVMDAVGSLGRWRLQSAMTRGSDILDVPVALGADETIDDLVVTLTDSHTDLTGTLLSSSRVAAPDYVVVVFSANRALWRPASRRIQSTRPDTDGRFAFRDLPAGEYRLAALTDIDAADLLDTSFLDALVPGSLAVTIRDGEITTQDVRLR